jgi:hypothetical protein
MPFLAGRGQAGRGIFGLGGVPGAPTFPNTPGTEGDVAIPITFIAPAFNGRTNNNWLQVCSFNIGR